ncbi:MAG: sensor histidine kinase, partial [Desulfovibrionales bacterium]
ALLSLINDILDFSKIESGKLDLESLNFALRPMLDSFTAMTALRAEEKGLEFICAADPDVPDNLIGDPGRIRQVLTNLAGNAVKFTERGEVVVRVQRAAGNAGMLECWDAGIPEKVCAPNVSGTGGQSGAPESNIHAQRQEMPSVQQGSDSSIPASQHSSISTVTLLFTIRDTGIGIPPDKLDDLFQSFTQVDASITRKFGGTGLGLAISRQLAGMMGGEVGVESVEGQGSTFWFTVRLGLGEAVETPVPDPTDLHGIHTLIVDDNATNREILLARCQGWGMRPAEAPDGPTALKLLYAALAQGDPFRLAVLDMQMPGMDGETLGRVISSEPTLQPLPTVMLTSLGREGDAKRLQEAGFSAYLTKPVLHGELFDCLTMVLARDGQSSSREIMARRLVREPGSRKTFTPRKARVLLAEDNPTNQQVILAMLDNLGLSADTVANGAEAVRALQSIPYDLVLMDVQMPVMDGLAATRRIRSQKSEVRSQDSDASNRTSDIGDRISEPQVSGLSPQPSPRRLPIIALTAHAMQGYREQCLEAGMDDYLAKPLEPAQLAEMLEKWLPVETRDLAAPDVEGEPEKQEQQATVSPREVDNKPLETNDPALGERDLPVFNKADFMRRVSGKKRLADNILRGFLGDGRACMEKLNQVIDDADITAILEHAHSLKGMASLVSARTLADQSSQVELAGKAGDLAACRELMPRVEFEFQRLAAELESELTDVRAFASLGRKNYDSPM